MIPSLVYGQEDIDSLSIVLEIHDEDTLDPEIISDCIPIIAEYPGGQDSLFAYLKRTIT